MLLFKGFFLETAVERIIKAVSDAIQSALGISLLDMAIQILATLILVLVVRFFLWNKITDYLGKRKQFLTDEVENAKQANEQAAQLKEETEKEYERLKARSKDIIDSARQRGEDEQADIVSRAKREAEQIYQDSLKEIEVEKEKARLKMKDEVIELAALMAEKIIEQEVDHQKYLERSIESLGQGEEK